MKKMLFIAVAVLGVSSVAYSQTTETKSATTNTVTPPAVTTTEAVTTAATPTTTTTTAATTTTPVVTNAKGDISLKKHACTSDCHNGKGCVYKHGEEGHVDTDACKESMHNHHMNKYGKEKEHMEKKPRKK